MLWLAQQQALAVGYSAAGTKSRIAPRFLKAVECKSAWTPVLFTIRKKTLNTETVLYQPGRLSSESALLRHVPAPHHRLHTGLRRGRGATGEGAVWRTGSCHRSKGGFAIRGVRRNKRAVGEAGLIFCMVAGNCDVSSGCGDVAAPKPMQRVTLVPVAELGAVAVCAGRLGAGFVPAASCSSQPGRGMLVQMAVKTCCSLIPLPGMCYFTKLITTKLIQQISDAFVSSVI